MNVFKTSREIPAPVEEVFAAIADRYRLARWWGPDGFINTFHTFEFEPGGKWVYTMHAPNGGNPANESAFEEIKFPSKVVIRHDSQPLYRLTIELKDSADGTTVLWTQEFDDPEVAARIAKIVLPANEQNLDRLTDEILSPQHTKP